MNPLKYKKAFLKTKENQIDSNKIENGKFLLFCIVSKHHFKQNFC